MPKPIDEILAPKPEGRPRIYAYSIEAKSHEGWLKVGETTREVKVRVKEQLGTAAIKHTIVLDEAADREDGTHFRDYEVHRALRKKGFENPEGEWFVCTLADVKTVLSEVRSGQSFSGTHDQTFAMRAEQAAAVSKTHDYFKKIAESNPDFVPRFLWNAKMRFGKTFAAYQLAKKMGAKRVLVVTFKPAVEDSWRSDLESHADFDGWQYLSRASKADPSEVTSKAPMVYFGSLQDLLGRDKTGKVKTKNEWLHKITWDLVIFDEYHFGAWRESTKQMTESEEEAIARKEALLENAKKHAEAVADLQEEMENEKEFLPMTVKACLYLSGTPFKALATGEFVEDQIFNWTYTDEQRAKEHFAEKNPDKPSPYAALPQMRLLTYQMPDELLAKASGGQFDEFDLNAFFQATGEGAMARFKYESEVQKWLDIIRGIEKTSRFNHLKDGEHPPFPYSDVRLLPYMQHAFWFMPNVASCHAMANLLVEGHNNFWHEYDVKVCAGKEAGIGLKALPPVRDAIGSGYDTKTIVLSCGKLTTGVTIPQWSSILMLRNLKSPETYFQAAFRVQSPWAIRNPDGDDPHREEVLKPICYVFDFAPTRALRQLSDYAIGLSPDESNPEKSVKDLIAFLPVLAHNGSYMSQIDAGQVLDIAIAGTSATLLARKWESAVLVRVDNDTLSNVLKNEEALAAIEKIEGWRALGDNVIETIINKSEKIKKLKNEEKEEGLTKKKKKELSDEEREFKSLRKKIQEKLIKFATRIPPFMYLTDFRENSLEDIIKKLEPELFLTVTGLTIEDFDLLRSLKVFNTEHMNQAVFAFRRYEDASLKYTGIESHENLTHVGGYNTVQAIE